MPPSPTSRSAGLPAGDAGQEAELETHAEAARRLLWLAALHQIALADGHYSDEEAVLLEAEVAREFPGQVPEVLHLPGGEALVHRFGVGTPLAENFLRTAVVVALADGHISPMERELLHHWSGLLQVGASVLETLPVDVGCDTEAQPEALGAVRRWLDGIEPPDPAVARFLVRLIPAQCPFARDVTLFGRTVVRIPPMCKINPLYEQLMALRFRCLCSLEECGEKEA